MQDLSLFQRLELHQREPVSLIQVAQYKKQKQQLLQQPVQLKSRDLE